MASAIIAGGCSGGGGNESTFAQSASTHYNGNTEKTEITHENTVEFANAVFLTPLDPLESAATSESAQSHASLDALHRRLYASKISAKNRAKVFHSEQGKCLDSGNYKLKLESSGVFAYGKLTIHYTQCNEFGITLNGDVSIGVLGINTSTSLPSDYKTTYHNLSRRTLNEHYVYNGNTIIENRMHCGQPGSAELNLVIDNRLTQDQYWFNRMTVNYLTKRRCRGEPSYRLHRIDGDLLHSRWGTIKLRTTKNFSYSTELKLEGSGPPSYPDTKGTVELVGQNKTRAKLFFNTTRDPGANVADQVTEDYTRFRLTSSSDENVQTYWFRNDDLDVRA